MIRLHRSRVLLKKMNELLAFCLHCIRSIPVTAVQYLIITMVRSNFHYILMWFEAYEQRTTYDQHRNDEFGYENWIKNLITIRAEKSARAIAEIRNVKYSKHKSIVSGWSKRCKTEQQISLQFMLLWPMLDALHRATCIAINGWTYFPFSICYSFAFV